jgi:hypothetical protein
MAYNIKDVFYTNALNVATAAYYAPGATANNEGFFDMVMPSKDVPYVIVRDNACLIYELGSVVAAATGDLTLSARLECAQISLDQATLNQLLRTQTV